MMRLALLLALACVSPLGALGAENQKGSCTSKQIEQGLTQEVEVKNSNEISDDRDKAVEVIKQATASLKTFYPKGNFGASNEPSGEVRPNRSGSTVPMENKAVTTLLSTLTDSPSMYEHTQAVKALGSNIQRWTVSSLNDNVKTVLIETVKTVLIETMKSDPDGEPRVESAIALGGEAFSGASTLVVLTEAMTRNTHQGARAAAAKALCKATTRDDIEEEFRATVNRAFADRLANDPDEKVRLPAVQALGRYLCKGGAQGDRDRLDALIGALIGALQGDRDTSVRDEAVRFLGRIGKKADWVDEAPGMVALKNAAEADDDEDIREDAARFVGTIQSGKQA